MIINLGLNKTIYPLTVSRFLLKVLFSPRCNIILSLLLPLIKPVFYDLHFRSNIYSVEKLENAERRKAT